jgi:hypothetical protein
MTPETPEPEQPTPPTHLKTLRPHNTILTWSLAGIAFSSLGLFVITGWSPSVWLFLLYPLLIAILVCSLSLLVLHLLRRF